MIIISLDFRYFTEYNYINNVKGGINMSDKAFDTEKNKEVFAVDCISAKKGRYICHLCYEKGKVVPVFLRKTDGEKRLFLLKLVNILKDVNFL